MDAGALRYSLWKSLEMRFDVSWGLSADRNAATTAHAPRRLRRRKTPPQHTTPIFQFPESDDFNVRLVISTLQDYIESGNVDNPQFSHTNAYNSVPYPTWDIEKVNLDIILEVLHHYVASQTDGVFILMLVSKSWRDFVLESPILWQWITFNERSPDWLEKSIVCASLSSSLPLQIVVRLPFKSWDHLIALLPRIRNIFFEIPDYMTGIDVREETGWFLANANLPAECRIHWYRIGGEFLRESRESLSLDMNSVTDIALWADGSEHLRYRDYAETRDIRHLETGDEFHPRLLLKVFHVLEVLRNSPNLRTLTLSHYAVDPISSDINLPAFTLPGLQSLEITDIDHRRNGTLLPLVESINLPSLSTISLAGECADILELTNFLLSKSSPLTLNLRFHSCFGPSLQLMRHNGLALITSVDFHVLSAPTIEDTKFYILKVIKSLIQPASGLINAHFAFPRDWYQQDETFMVLSVDQWRNIRSLTFSTEDSPTKDTLLEYSFSPVLSKVSLCGSPTLTSRVIVSHIHPLTVKNLEVEVQDNVTFHVSTLAVTDSQSYNSEYLGIKKPPLIQLMESLITQSSELITALFVLPLHSYESDQLPIILLEAQRHNIRSLVFATRVVSSKINLLEYTFSPEMSKARVLGGSTLVFSVAPDYASHSTRAILNVQGNGDIEPLSLSALPETHAQLKSFQILKVLKRPIIQLIKSSLRSAPQPLYCRLVFPMEWYQHEKICEILSVTQWHEIRSFVFAVWESSEEVTLLDYSSSPTTWTVSLSGIYTMIFSVLKSSLPLTTATLVEVRIDRPVFNELPLDVCPLTDVHDVVNVSKSIEIFSVLITDWSFTDREVGPILEGIAFVRSLVVRCPCEKVIHTLELASGFHGF